MGWGEMGEKEYILFCDESDRHGKYYSNFYGGVMVGASQYERVTRRLDTLKLDLNLYGEIKWKKVTKNYLEKYITLMSAFFDELNHGNLRIRIMYRQNAHQATGLHPKQVELEYFMLYYQFIKHAYGLRHAPEPIKLRLYFDTFPDTREKAKQFKGYLLGLTETNPWQDITILPEDITEVRSHDHVLLQCMDVVLGSMSFRLNDKHKEKPAGTRQRGNRTIAKEKLYKAILGEIRKIRPGFNVGISTRVDDYVQRWTAPYLHWNFIPSNSEFNNRLTKKNNKPQK
jgi:hypothetical protein